MAQGKWFRSLIWSNIWGHVGEPKWLMHLVILNSDGYAMMSLAITFIVDTMSPWVIAFIINKTLNLSMAQFLHLLNEHNDNCFLPSLGVPVKINKLAFSIYFELT